MVYMIALLLVEVSVVLVLVLVRKALLRITALERHLFHQKDRAYVHPAHKHEGE